MLVADVLVALAAVTLLATTWRAVRLDPLPAAAPATTATRGATLAERDASAVASDVELDNDPFRADRQLPEPAEPEADVMPVADAAPAIAPESVRLLGTVVLAGNRSFAVYQLPSQVPRTLHVGESVGGLRLEAVVPGQATFRAADGTRIELHLPKPGA
jgi:hypothetical protein